MERTSTVYVSKEDKEKLEMYAERIGEILNKYPYSNDYSDHFVTAMTDVKNSYNQMKKSIRWLKIK